VAWILRGRPPVGVTFVCSGTPKIADDLDDAVWCVSARV